MNIILITEKECELGIAKTDARAFHIDNILKKRENEALLLGIEGNPIIYQANIERNQDFYVFKNLVYCEACPSLTVHKSLKSYLKTLSQKLLSEKRIAFDVEKKSYPHILNYSLTTSKIFLAIGSERGWTSEEIQELKNCHFSFLSLGNRILRTETASLISLYYFSEQIDQLTFQPNFGKD